MVKPGETDAPDAPPAAAAVDLLESFTAGSTIYDEGSTGDRMFIIEDGTVELFRRPARRRLAKLGRGDFFGERSLLEDRPRESSARALTDCRLLPVDASSFDAMLRRYPEIAIRMLRSMTRRLSAHEEAQHRANLIAASATSAVKVPAETVILPPAAYLVHATGRKYPIRAEAVTHIGRTDPVTRIAPEVDLDELDDRQTLSRRHARITARDGRFLLGEHIGTANGTFVGSRRLAAGEEVEIHDGARLRFGLLAFDFQVEASN